GRKLADDIMSYMRTKYTQVYEMSRKHCKILKMLNRMHIGINGYNRILGSKLYNKLRHNKSFD
ncbi:MAG: glycosyltransferase family 2 protein, partial [Ruminiclostridium sp.]|nr:glycosyltransferase family 2 protein [Ruminiclostridium sp.]